jgi:hypothetical protein
MGEDEPAAADLAERHQQLRGERAGLALRFVDSPGSGSPADDYDLGRKYRAQGGAISLIRPLISRFI